MKSEYDQILTNINISEDMKERIYKNCIKNKRTGDVRFRYSHLFSILIGAAVFALLSLGAYAAVTGVKQRMEEMPEEEYADYEQEVENDTFISIDEGFSRELYDSEIKRIIELEREYYDNSVFPANAMAHVETKDEIAGVLPAYVAEDNMVYLPEDEMTDEQLLQYIDHDAKKWYVNARMLEEEGFDTGINSQLSYESTPTEAGSMEDKARAKAEGYIKQYFGVDISTDDSWIVCVDHFEADPELDMEESYYVSVDKKGTGYASGYQIEMNAADLSPLMLNTFGYEVELEAEKFSFEEADAREGQMVECAKKALKEVYGLGEPVRYTYNNESDYNEDTQTTGFVCIEFYYDDAAYHTRVRLEDGQVISFIKR